MKQGAFRQNKTNTIRSKKACPRQRGQAAMSMYYTMQIDFITLPFPPGWSVTCRANFVVSCGLSVRAGGSAEAQTQGAVSPARLSHPPADRG